MAGKKKQVKTVPKKSPKKALKGGKKLSEAKLMSII